MGLFEGKKPTKSHYLHDSFKLLSPKTRQSLERKWDLITRDREELSKNIDRQEKTPIPRNLRDAASMVAAGQENEDS
jgi:hypothetical protein